MSRKRKSDEQEQTKASPATDQNTEPTIGTKDPELGSYLGNGMWVKKN